MNNYAIVLGVDKYKNAVDLPSCKNDANLIEGLLTATGKYEVLRIKNNATKHQVIEAISSFSPSFISSNKPFLERRNKVSVIAL